MNIVEYFQKDTSITLLDMLLVAMVASIFSPIIVFIYKKTVNFIKKSIEAIIEKSKYQTRIKKGNITMKDHRNLEKKERDGSITTKEQVALDIERKKLKDAMGNLQLGKGFTVPDLPSISDINRVSRDFYKE